MVAAAQVLAIGMIALPAGYLLERPWVVALAGIATAAYLVLSTAVTALVLHPADPIGTSSSLATRATYYGLLLVAALLALQTSWLLAGGGREDGGRAG